MQQVRMVFLSRDPIHSNGIAAGVSETDFNDILKAGGWTIAHVQWLDRSTRITPSAGWECLLTRDLPEKNVQSVSEAVDDEVDSALQRDYLFEGTLPIPDDESLRQENG